MQRSKYQSTTAVTDSVNTLAADLFRPRLIPLKPGLKVPYAVSDGVLPWGELGPVDEYTVSRWHALLHPAWGVRTGLLPGLAQASLVVLDVDRPDAAPDWIEDADLFPWRISTPRGVHLYGWTGEPLPSRKLPYGDLQSQRRYVVHSQPTGAYRPQPGFGEGGQIPLWPASILADLLRPQDTPRPQRPQTRPAAPGRRLTVGRVDIPVGRRNVSLFDLLCLAAGRTSALRGDALRLAGLARWLNAALDSPLPDGEIEKLARQVAGYSAGWESSTETFSARQRARQRIQVQRRREANSDRDARIVVLRAEGKSVSTIARQIGVSPSTVKRAIRGA